MKEENIMNFYMLTNRLKKLIRAGTIKWNVQRERRESVAEHIYGTQMLAIAMYYEFEYDLNLKKVLYMLAVHELEEIVIGDITMFEISAEEKKKIGYDAVNEVIKTLENHQYLRELIDEFEAKKTPEAIFAFYCDKLDWDIQSKIDDEEGCVDIKNQNNEALNDELVKKLLSENKSYSEMTILFGQQKHKYDENFLKVSNYVLNNKIVKK